MTDHNITDTVRPRHAFKVTLIRGDNSGQTFGRGGFWDGPTGIAHLEDHLLVGPTGRVFWRDHEGNKEITDQVKLEWLNPE